MTWLKSILGGNKGPSGSIAKNRLQMVLTHDRGDLSPALLEEIRDDIIEIITKRLSLNRNDVVVHLNHTPQESCLVAEIPLQTVTSTGRRKR